MSLRHSVKVHFKMKNGPHKDKTLSSSKDQAVFITKDFFQSQEEITSEHVYRLIKNTQFREQKWDYGTASMTITHRQQLAFNENQIQLSVACKNSGG